MSESSPSIESVLFKALPVPAFVLDPVKGRILAANAALETLLGRSTSGIEIGELLDRSQLPAPQEIVPLRCVDGMRDVQIYWNDVLVGGEPALLCVLQLMLTPDPDTDLLTGLPSRARMIETLERALAAVQTEGAEVGILRFDLDDLRQVNKTLGHDVGDRLLRAVGGRLKAVAESGELVCRMDGDAFVIVLPKVRDINEVVKRAKRLAQILEDGFDVDGRSISASFSVGATAGCIGAESLLMKAERAVEQAKANGGNSLRIAEVVSADRFAVQRDARRGLDADEFFLLYQPIVDLRDRRVVGAEAFLRWRAAGEVRQPTDFMRDVDADAELSLAIGTRVLEIACAQGVKWESSGLRLRIGVNISLPHFHHPKFIDRLNCIINVAGMSPSLLEVEVTETTFSWDPQRTWEILSGLRRIGVGLAIDDYDVGMLPFEPTRFGRLSAVKMPRELVATLESQRGGVADEVLTSAMSLASRVVAVGVESEMHNAMLLRMGCPEAQGYYFSRPVDAQTFERVCMPTLAEPIRIIA